MLIVDCVVSLINKHYYYYYYYLMNAYEVKAGWLIPFVDKRVGGK